MITSAGYRTINIALFAIANLMNILTIGVFLSRPRGLKLVERSLGLVLIALALPVSLAVILNLPSVSRIDT